MVWDLRLIVYEPSSTAVSYNKRVVDLMIVAGWIRVACEPSMGISWEAEGGC